MKRPWFQYHLSTAIILMFVASGLLWLNLTESTTIWRLDDVPFSFRQWGWPFLWPHNPWAHSQPYFISPSVDYYSPLIVDAAIATALLVFIAFVLEYRIRRQQRTTNAEARTTGN
jgi:hypothetical protein